MPTKADLEHADQIFFTHGRNASELLKAGDYVGALDEAEKSLPFVDGMMQYRKKYASQAFDSIPTIDIILYVAPVLFRRSSLDAVGQLLANTRRIEKNTNENLANKLRESYRRMWDARTIWDAIALAPKDASIRLEIPGDEAELCLKIWKEMDLVRVVTNEGRHSCTPITNMEEVVRCKCNSCGATGKTRKSALLDKVKCPRCSVQGYFVILGGV